MRRAGETEVRRGQGRQEGMSMGKRKERGEGEVRMGQGRERGEGAWEGEGMGQGRERGEGVGEGERVGPGAGEGERGGREGRELGREGSGQGRERGEGAGGKGLSFTVFGHRCQLHAPIWLEVGTLTIRRLLSPVPPAGNFQIQRFVLMATKLNQNTAPIIAHSSRFPSVLLLIRLSIL